MLRYIPFQAQPDDALLMRMAEENKISKLLASALFRRGICAREEVENFLHPSLEQLYDPFLLPDMREAVARIKAAITAKEPVCVYGDYDADGVCGSAMLLLYLRSVGAEVEAYIPSRHEEGYGMHVAAIQALHARGKRLIITVDNGIAAVEEVALCSTLGMDVVVTDHHQCPEILPVCVAVVNAHRKDSAYPYKHLCGAGVVLKLIQALGGKEAMQTYLPLAAVATVADIVELLDENRAIVAMGMQKMDANAGLSELKMVSGSASHAVTSETVAFQLAPRLNAAGRMGEASRALRLLTTDDTAEARKLALELNDANEERQKIERSILRSAKNMLAGKDTARMRAILLYSPEWNAGVIGIVAAKLCEAYYRPTLLFHQEGDVLVGSCRSIAGVNLFACLQPFEKHFTKYGGHAQAAGITMPLENFKAFETDFQKYLAEAIPAAVFIPAMRYEEEADLSELSRTAIALLEALEPYGEGNPRPVYRAKGIGLTNIARMGSEGTHLQGTVTQGKTRLRMVGFGRGAMEEELSRAGDCPYDLLYAMHINTFQGVTRPDLHMRAIRREDVFAAENALPALHNKFYDAFFRNFLYNVTRAVSKEGSQAYTNDMLVEALHADICGTLVLVHTLQGALDLREFLSWQDVFVPAYCSCLPEEAATYNAVLVAPELSRLASNEYERVIVYDGGELALLPVTKGGQMVFTGPSTQNYDMLAPLQMPREALATYYGRFSKACRRQEQPRELLLQAVMDGAGAYPAAMLTLAMFVELGFFKWNEQHDSIRWIEGCGKRDIAESRLYAMAQAGRSF